MAFMYFTTENHYLCSNIPTKGFEIGSVPLTYARIAGTGAKKNT